MGKDLITRR